MVIHDPLVVSNNPLSERRRPLKRCIPFDDRRDESGSLGSNAELYPDHILDFSQQLVQLLRAVGTDAAKQSRYS